MTFKAVINSYFTARWHEGTILCHQQTSIDVHLRKITLHQLTKIPMSCNKEIIIIDHLDGTHSITDVVGCIL